MRTAGLQTGDTFDFMFQKMSLVAGVVVALLAAGCSDAGATTPSASSESMVTVGVRAGSPIALTAPINGSNLDYAGVGQDFAASGVMTAVRDFQGGTIRYPGGAISNYWDWQNGSLHQPATISGSGRFKPARTRGYGFTLQTLQSIVRETGTVPVFDLNLLTSNLADQLQMLHTAQNLGIPVRYVELGNEFYLGISSYQKVFPTAASYARTVAKWAPAIRAAFPKVQIAAVGSLPQSTGREKSWNKTLLAIAGADINAITLHDYFAPVGRNLNPMQFLAEVQSNWLSTEQVMATFPSRYRIWFTEFNLSRQGLLGGRPARGITWLHGLYAAESVLLFDQSPRVQLDDYWDLFSNSFTGAFTSGLAPQPTVSGSALMFLTSASTQAVRVTPLRFSAAPTLPGGAAGVIGASFSGPIGTRTVLINLTNRAITMSDGTSTGLSPRASLESITAAPTSTVSGLNRTTGVLGTRLTLPAYSITGVGFTVPTPAKA